jgi:hypothetical protein
MANLNIKDVPEKLHKRLKKSAKVQGRSLNSYVIQVLQMSEDEHARRARMSEGWEEYQEFMKSLPRLGNSMSWIRKDRETNHGRA